MTNSPVESERREEILKTMLAEAGRLRRRRRLVHVGGVLLVFAAAALALFPRDRDEDQVVGRPDAAPSVSSSRTEKPPSDGPTDESLAPARFEIVHTRPGIAAEHMIERAAGGGAVNLLSDDELLLELAELGRPAALVRTADQVSLTDPDGNRLSF